MRKDFTALAVLIVCSLAISSSGFADDDINIAPFGLKWGMTTAEARALGIDLQDAPIKDFGVSYGAIKLPKVITDISAVILSFGYDDKLWRIAAISKDFLNDPYGVATKDRYNELTRIMSDKYGRGAPHHQDAPYSQPQYFLMEIKNGSAWDYTDFTTSEIWAQLGISAKDSSTGFYKIIFENRPLATGFQNAKKLREKNAL